MSKDKTFCILPWIHLCVRTNNTLRPCCRYIPEDYKSFNTSIDSFPTKGIETMNDALFTKIRQNMLQGNKDPGCIKCYDQEDRAGFSLRTLFNEQYKDIKVEENNTNFKLVRYIEMSLDNICNLECKMCSSEYSTKLIKRDSEFRDPVHKKLEPNFTKFDSIDLSELQEIKILGGEPFITPNLEKFLDYISNKSDISKITLIFATNATTMPSPKVSKKLKKFKGLTFFISLDSYDKVNDYQRQNSSYLETFENSQNFLKMFDNCVYFSYHSVVTLLNANVLSKSLNFLEVDNKFNVSIDFARHPEYLSLLYAPDDYLNWVIDLNKDNERAYTLVSKFAKNSKYDDDHWSMFLKRIKMWNNFYKNDLKDYNLELHNFLNKYSSYRES
jgi:sulfatase maturation enzyme AslB (radical SAM superfamily)